MKSAVIAKMVSTSNGQGRTFQAYGLKPEQRAAVTAELRSEVAKKAQAFTRDDHPSLMVVEFWSDDVADIEAACEHFAATLGVKLGKGKPTAEELSKVA